jgi:hypothetical protein
MKTSRGSVVLDCVPAIFWQIYAGEGYLRSLYLETLGYLGLEILERSAEAYKIRIMPKLNVPAAVQKLLGDRFVYENHGSLDRERNVWTWRMVQAGDPGKKSIISTRGTIRIEAVGTTQCRRVDEVVLESTLFGVGSMIESAAEKEAQAAREKEYALLQRLAKEA